MHSLNVYTPLVCTYPHGSYLPFQFHVEERYICAMWFDSTQKNQSSNSLFFNKRGGMHMMNVHTPPPYVRDPMKVI